MILDKERKDLPKVVLDSFILRIISMLLYGRFPWNR